MADPTRAAGISGAFDMSHASHVPGRPDVVGAVLLGGGSRRMGREKAQLVIEGETLLARTLRTLGEVAGRIALVGAPDGVPIEVGANDTEPPASPTPRTVPDLRAEAGPLAGLETALLTHPEADVVLVVGVDHPWLQAPVLAELCRRLLDANPDEARAGDDADGVRVGDRGGDGRGGGNRGGGNRVGGERRGSGGGCEAVMLGTDRGPQPLLAAYRPRASRAVSDLLDAGERRLRVVADHLDVQVLEPSVWRTFDPFGATAVDVDTPEELAGAMRWQARRRATLGAPIGPSVQAVPAVPVVRVRDGRSTTLDDTVIGEEPLEVRAAGPGQEPVTLMTTLRTPGHEREQAVGWLLAEAFATPEQIVAASIGDALELARPEDTVTVSLTVPVDPAAGARRHAVATASCGVCGRASIDELAARTRPVTGDRFRDDPLAWDLLARLPDELRFAQPRFRSTGGVHATGLFDEHGRLVTVREDVGRHNALDAAIGAHVLAGDWPGNGLDDLVCVLSGRIGFELVAKAAVARLPVVAAVGAASDLAVRTADRLGVTLVGFVRGGRGTVYTHPERLLLP
jgi:FdhD protein